MKTGRQGIGHSIYQGHQIIVHRSGRGGGYVAYISAIGRHGEMTQTPMFDGKGAKQAAAWHARQMIDGLNNATESK